MRMFKFCIPTIALFLFFSTAHAASDVRITEVMYDTPQAGSEKGYEWLEICNEGGEDVPITSYVLYEGSDANKEEKSITGNPDVLGVGACILLVNDKELFDDFLTETEKGYYTDNQIYLSDFNLSNSGETLSLHDENSVLISGSEISYKPRVNANGTGYSIIFSGGDWVAVPPTPGVLDSTVSTEEDEEDDADDSTDDNSSDTTSSKRTSDQWIPEPDIYAYAGEDKEVVAGASVVLSGVAGDASGETMDRAEYVWNFGDGEIKRGKSLVHTYRYPGTYIAHLTVISGEISAHDTITIVAVAPDVQVVGYERGGLDPYVALINSGSEMIDLSYWRIRVAGEMFRIPEYTYIAPKTELRFSRDTMNIDFPETSDVALLYPNLRVVDVLWEEKPEEKESTARGASIPESSQPSVPPRATTQSSSQYTRDSVFCYSPRVKRKRWKCYWRGEKRRGEG
jgi:hypothetical protein